ncbi:MAG: carboxypeptidase regulatory-like domain-containing protein [Candidatus Hydrogenedentes bacterium]|nr:carboxypeptidase regulatory-like domain-containing protein [Candidatus Hydrogenedentota bacterium]
MKPVHFQGVAAGSENVDFVLVRRGRLIGQVIDAATGAPLTSYQITSEGGSSVPRFQSIADPSGQFAVEVETGNVYLRVRAPGYADQEHLVKPPTAPGEDRDGIVIALQRAGQ